MKKIIFIVIMMCQIVTYAQMNRRTGHVSDMHSKSPVPGATISIRDAKGGVYKTSSDSTGQFSIPLSLILKGTYISVDALSYERYKIEITSIVNDRLELTDIKLDPSGQMLKEVAVHSRRRYSDTTDIDLSKQKFDRSITIDDLFSQTQGFYKDNAGQLYYKGKPVADLVVNGRNFFGKNNSDILHLLPALVLNGIEIVETNIDSVTNVTKLRPSIKINLKLKDQYNNGKFGNAGMAIGTEKRYFGATSLYAYRGKEQVSLMLNSNNVNIADNPGQEPAISFSANGNNTTLNNTRFTYDNVIGRKIDVSVFVKGKIENREFLSESERQDKVVNQLSKTVNNTRSKSLGIPDAGLSLKYRIDTSNVLSFLQSGRYNKTTNKDSLNYLIQSDSQTNISRLNKDQLLLNNYSSTEVSYIHKFASKRGRFLEVKMNRLKNGIENNEFDNVYSLTNNNLKVYFIDNKKRLDENQYSFSSVYTEPLSDDSYFNIFLTYKNDRVHYTNDLVSDSLFNFSNVPVRISNQYFQSGLKFQKTFRKISFTGDLAGLLDERDNFLSGQKSSLSFFNFNVDVSADYKIDNKKSLLISYKKVTNYAEVSQVVNINNSFDLVSQTNGNLDLKPEIKNSFKVAYILKKSDSESINLNADMDLYRSKYGTNVSALPNETQSVFIDNIGNATYASLGMSMAKNIFGNFLINYTNSVVYLEQPAITNKRVNLNNGVNFNQAISTAKEVFKNVLSISPSFSATYGRYYYETSKADIINVTYSDKIMLSVGGFKLEAYPLMSFSRNINSLTSFSMNAAIRKILFNKYASVWLQGYDVFNSFKINNNLLGPSYIQMTRFSNINRYFVVGFSFKFNNMK